MNQTCKHNKYRVTSLHPDGETIFVDKTKKHIKEHYQKITWMSVKDVEGNNMELSNFCKVSTRIK